MHSSPIWLHILSFHLQSHQTGALNSPLLYGCTRLGIQHKITTANHPQINWMVDRIHRQIRDALRAPTLGVFVSTCSTKGEVCCLIAELVTESPLNPSYLLHVLDPPRADVPPPLRRPESYAAAADSSANSLGQSRARVRAL
jgi:hypothetical protein